MSFYFENIKNKKTATSEQIGMLHALECEACPLNNSPNCHHPKMDPSGDPKADIYVLGEAPGSEEDRQGEPFVGQSGKLLKGVLTKAVLKVTGTDPKKAQFPEINEAAKGFIRFNNVIRTHPPRNRDPAWQEMECCRPSVIADIEKVKPKLVIGVGNIPLRWAFDDDGITKWRGQLIPVKIGKHVCWYYPVLHPAAILRQRSTKGTPGAQEKVFEEDLLWCFQHAHKLEPPEIPTEEEIVSDIRFSEDYEKSISLLEEVLEWSEFAVDIETNDLRPYGDDSRILSIAFSNGEETISVPVEHSILDWTEAEVAEVYELLSEILSDKTKTIVAHNLAFELEWFCYFLSKELMARQAKWQDTMAQAYVLDTRLLSLDFLCLKNFGFRLKQLSSVDQKNIEKEPIDKLLRYNALDAKWTYWLYLLQSEEVEKAKLEDVYSEQIRRIPTTVLTQLKGLLVDQDKVEFFVESLTNQIEELKIDISKQAAVRTYEDKYGEFNPSSPKQVAVVLSEILHITKGYRGPNASYTTASSVLEQISHPFARNIIEFRQTSKLLNTFVKGLRKKGKYLWPDGKLHPNFNTMFTTTRRLSSSNPNGQNFPSRRHKEIRSQVIPPKDHMFAACDYGQIEARIIGAASGDSFLCKALWEDYDIHMEWAERIAKAYPARVGGTEYLKDEAALKLLRTDIKNSFVFPLFYGSWYKPVAADTGIPDHICKQLEEEFWKTFSGVKDWQESLSKFYEKNFFLTSLTGFIYRAPLDRNKLYNYPIQGTASDVVVDAMNRLSEHAISSNKWQFQPCLNIHDDLTFALPESSLDEDLDFIIEQMLDCKFSFLSVPISVEVSVGYDWYNLEEVGTYSSKDWFSKGEDANTGT